MDAYEVLSRQIAAKSDVRVEQAVVTAALGRVATVTMRGASVAGVECLSDPTVGERIWVLADKGRLIGLSAAPPATVAWYAYRYQGTDVTVDPGPGNWTVEVGGGGVRTLAFSKTDDTGEPRAVMLMQTGDTLTITDDPDTPPITGWVRYVLASDPVDHGTWATVTALRTDTIGSSNPPNVGDMVRVYTTWSAQGTSLDGRYVRKDGDTMTGALALPGDPGAALEAAPKQYVDAAEVAAKAYADTGDSARVAKSGDTMTGNLDMRGLAGGKVWDGSWNGLQAGGVKNTSGPALLMGHATSKNAYLMSGVGGQVLLRAYSAESVQKEATFDSSGYLTLPSSPASAGHATRKDYVDAKNNGVGSAGLILYNLSPSSDYTIPGSGTYYTVPGCSISIAGPCSLHVGWTLSYNAPSWTNVVNIYAKITCTGASSASASGRARFGPAVNTGSAAEMNVNSSVVLNVPSGTVNIYGQCYQSNTSNSGMNVVAGYTMLSIFGIKWT